MPHYACRRLEHVYAAIDGTGPDPPVGIDQNGSNTVAGERIWITWRMPVNREGVQCSAPLRESRPFDCEPKIAAAIFSNRIDEIARQAILKGPRVSVAMYVVPVEAY